MIQGSEFSSVPHPAGSRQSKFCLQKAQELFEMDQLAQGVSVIFLNQTAYPPPIFFHLSSTPGISPPPAALFGTA